ncbi:hypothetical protein [Flavobacterium sp.]|uniref:hypothetical protein n=1 Tax=Flavobacterium sp. TaxID=239 RepID=UPI002638D3E0|nr:hypothetical protein [Flavobacterium sp.]
MKKLLGLFLTLFFLSCSSDGSTDGTGTGGNGGGGGNTVVDPFKATVDGTSYVFTTLNNSNIADASGGLYGNAYFLIKGNKDTGAAKQGSTISGKIDTKKYEIKLAIPKSNVAVGTHNFASAIQPNEYYADLDITGVAPAQTVVTNTGNIKITSYNATTKKIVGTFTFTTTNGSTAAITHNVNGTFDYVLP